jgi:hypothetical protein
VAECCPGGPPNRVVLVDGETIRDHIEEGFVGGTNDCASPDWCPDRTVLLEKGFSHHDLMAFLVHELRERNLMANHGKSYEDAHRSANEVEARYRKQVKHAGHIAGPPVPHRIPAMKPSELLCAAITKLAAAPRPTPALTPKPKMSESSIGKAPTEVLPGPKPGGTTVGTAWDWKQLGHPAESAAVSPAHQASMDALLASLHLPEPKGAPPKPPMSLRTPVLPPQARPLMWAAPVVGAAGVGAKMQMDRNEAGDIEADNLKNTQANNTAELNRLVTSSGQDPKGDPRDSGFVDPKARSGFVADALDSEPRWADQAKLQSKGFQPELATEISKSRALGGARRNIEGQEGAARTANRGRLTNEFVTGAGTPEQIEGARSRAGIPALPPGAAPVAPGMPDAAAALEPGIAAADAAKVPPALPAPSEAAAALGAREPVAASLPPVPPALPAVADMGPTGSFTPKTVAPGHPGAGEGPAMAAVPPAPPAAPQGTPAWAPGAPGIPMVPASTKSEVAASKPKAPGTPRELDKPLPQDPGIMDRITNWIQDPANRNYLLAGGAIGAVGALAYLLSRDDEPAPKRRRRHATA